MDAADNSLALFKGQQTKWFKCQVHLKPKLYRTQKDKYKLSNITKSTR